MKITKISIHTILLMQLLWLVNACDTSKNIPDKNTNPDNAEAVTDTITYQKSTPFFQGIAFAEKDSSSFYITKNGRPAFKKVLQEYKPLDSVVSSGGGLERAYKNESKTMRIVQVKNGKSGMLNEKGEWVINPKYEKIAFVFNRYLQIKADGKTTYADSWGNFFVPLKFDDIQILNTKLFDVKKDGKWGLYNAETKKIIIPFEYDKFDYCSGCGQKSDYLYAKKDGKWGVINFENKVLVPFNYQHQHVNMRSDEWVAAFRKAGKNVIINIPQQKEFTTPEYKNLNIENGHLIASKIIDNKELFGLINRRGDSIISFEYSDIFNPYSSFQTGAYFSVEKDEKFGIIDTLGNVIIPPTYKNRLLVRGDYFISQEKDKMGLRDNKNKQLLPIEYDWIDLDEIRTDREKLDPIIRIRRAGKYGFYYPKTAKLVRPQYDNIKFFNDRQRNPFGVKPVGIISLEKDGKTKLYNLFSGKIIPGEYAAFQFQPHHKVTLIKENYSDQGIYDLEKEQLIIPIKYKFIQVYKDQNRFIKVEKDIGNHQTQAGLFDGNGKEILPINYTDIKQIDSIHFLLNEQDNSYTLFNTESSTKKKLPFTQVNLDPNSSLLRVKKDSKVYLYDYKKEKILLKKGYSSIQPLKNGNFLVTQEDDTLLKLGYANAKGKLIVPVVYDIREAGSLLNFQNKKYLPLFKKDKTSGRFMVGFANLDGKILVPAKFQKVFPEESGNGFLTMNDKRFGIITAEGREFLPAQFDIYLNSRLSLYRDTSNFSFPVAFKKDGVWHYITENGALLPVKANELISFQ